MKKLNLISLILIAIALVPLSVFAIPKQTGNFELNLSYQSSYRTVAFYIPESYDDSKNYSVIIGMHQGGSNCEQMRDMLANAAKSIDAILVCPEDDNFDGSMINTSLDYVKTHYMIDSKKIIITGNSAGGNTAFNWGFDNNKSLAGIIGIAPAVEDYAVLNYYITKTLPIGIIIGSKDDYVEVTDYMINEIKNNNGKSKYIVKNGVDHADPYYSSDDFTKDWLECYNFIMDNVSSVEDNKNIETLPVSPNPAKDFVSLSFDAQNDINPDIKLYDEIGNVINTDDNINISKNNIIINTGNLRSGVYYLQLKFGNLNKISKIIVSK